IVLAKEAKSLQPENPVAEIMFYKAKLAKQDDFNKNLKERKDEQFVRQLNDVDEASTGYVADIEFPALKKWQDITDRRKQYRRPGSRTPSPEELKIERSLSRDVSLHFPTAPPAPAIHP